MTDRLPNQPPVKENKERDDTDQVSCLDMLHSSDMDGLVKMTHVPELSPNVYGESSYMLNTDRHIAKQTVLSQLEELLPYETNASKRLLSEDARSSSSVEPDGPTKGQWHNTHSSFIGSRLCPNRTFAGAQRLCPRIYNADCTGRVETRGTSPEYGRVECYQSGVSLPVNPSVIKMESRADVTDTRLSCDGVFSEGRVFDSHRRVCVVCGDNASGCHYGAITCGSCKVFFKRAAEGKKNHLCAGRNDCTIDKLRRKNCPSCRLRRCFLCGMSLRGRRVRGASQTTSGLEEERHVTVRPGDGGQRDGECSIITAAHTQSASQPFLSDPAPSLHSSLSLLSVLQVIEPGMVNAGHDHAQPDCPASLLSSLNELGERQLVSVVRWAKAMPGFRDLHMQDQLSVIQSSWLGVMVIAMGWRSYTLTGASMLYFAPDLVFNEQRMRVSGMYDHCARMQVLSERFSILRITREEFLCMKALLLFCVVPVKGLRSQQCFDELRRAYINELDRLASQRGEATRTHRLFQLTQLLDFLQPIVRMLHQFTYDLFIQSQSLPIRVVFPDMISEIVSMHVPKMLTGLVQPILFHKTS